MMPFCFSWLSLFSLPVLYFVKDQKKLARINEISFMVVFGLLSTVVIVLFMVVNIALLPLAYLKTVMHKIVIYRAYRGTD